MRRSNGGFDCPSTCSAWARVYICFESSPTVLRARASDFEKIQFTRIDLSRLSRRILLVHARAEHISLWRLRLEFAGACPSNGQAPPAASSRLWPSATNALSRDRRRLAAGDGPLFVCYCCCTAIPWRRAAALSLMFSLVSARRA